MDSAINVYAGQSAFFMMLSFFPFLMFFFSLLNLTPLSEQDFLLWISSIIPQPFHEYIHAFANEIYAGTTGRISITILTAVFLSSKAFIALSQGMNSVYGVKEQRNYMIIRMYAILYSIVFALVMILMLGLLVFGNWLTEHLFLQIPLIGDILVHLMNFRVLVFVLVLFLFFWLLYVILPSQKQRIFSQIPGAVFSSAGWVLFSLGFSIYVDHFNNYASFYGTMTTIALIMVWLYACMYILFLGGFINNMI